MKRLVIVIFLFCSFTGGAQQLVLPGDFPDPSVVNIDGMYWATATTSNWAPAFPLLVSKDLKNWELKGHAFSNLPSWADYYFWAPEISYDNGKVYIYYSAHRRDGNLCVAVASADKPGGPYKDHGPLVCQEAGSIDGFPMRDENGKLFLIWKEDGNSVKKPTPIWAAEMNEDRTALIGEKKELFRNDAPWEANLVEGVAMIRRGDYFYAFYAGAGCCGRGCTYAVGVARAKSLLGPWEKYAENPVMTSTDKWKCPGHGTAIEMNGRNYFLYHAYNSESDVYAGRQGLLSEFVFTDDGWIKFITDDDKPMLVPGQIHDGFSGDTLAATWQWSVFDSVRTSLDNGVLQLAASEDVAFIGQKTFTTIYEAQASLITTHTTSEGGLALIGDEKNMMGLSLEGEMLRVWKLEEGRKTILQEKKIKSGEPLLFLRVRFHGPRHIYFSFSQDGMRFTSLSKKPVDGYFLPPWDRAVRVGLISSGDEGQVATFDDFLLRHK